LGPDNEGRDAGAPYVRPRIALVPPPQFPSGRVILAPMSETKRNWRRTNLIGADGARIPDDWSLLDDAGRSLARIYLRHGGPQAGRWCWHVLVAPDGTPFNGGTGTTATGREAREACEALVPPGVQERRPDARIIMIQTYSTITCPACGHRATEAMPADACLRVYECEGCGAVLRPKAGDCCVFCTYGDVPCPPVQEDRARARS
jgi:hypothetical protein